MTFKTKYRQFISGIMKDLLESCTINSAVSEAKKLHAKAEACREAGDNAGWLKYLKEEEEVLRDPLGDGSI